MKSPPHPGELIRTAVIESSRTYPGEYGGSLKVRRATLSELLHGKASLTPEMALRIEKAFGPDRDHNGSPSRMRSLMTWRKHVSQHLASQFNAMPPA